MCGIFGFLNFLCEGTFYVYTFGFIVALSIVGDKTIVGEDDYLPSTSVDVGLKVAI